MKKPILYLTVAAVTGMLLAPAAQARPTKRIDERTQMCRLIGEGRLDWESETWGLGAQKFQEVCKECHHKGNDKGAPFLHAESYTAKGWNSVFARRGSNVQGTAHGTR